MRFFSADFHRAKLNHQMSKVLWNSDIDVYNTDLIPISVARNICTHLALPDLLNFSLVSRNAYKLVNEPELWVSKFKMMGLWHNGKRLARAGDDSGDGDSTVVLDTTNKSGRIDSILKDLDNPLLCLDNIISSKKGAKMQLIRVYKSLFPYYNDLLLNKPYDKLNIFKDFNTPQDQSKILRNLLKFNIIDPNETTKTIIKDKINALLELFENALLRELEIHYDLEDFSLAKNFVDMLIELNNQQTLIDFYLQKVLFNEKELITIDENLFDDTGLNPSVFNSLIDTIVKIFNEQSSIIDQIFPQSVPMMYKVCEELVTNQLTALIIKIIDFSKEKNIYLQVIPFVYEKFTIDFVEKLAPCNNIGESYVQLIRELIDMSFDSIAAEYMRQELTHSKMTSSKVMTDWNESVLKQELETTESIWKNVKTEKSDFLTSFKNVFKKNEMIDDFATIEAKAKELSESLNSLTKIINPELVLSLLNKAKLSINRLIKFETFSIQSVKNDIFATMQDIFINIIDTIGNEHIKPGFTKAIILLQTYNPNSPTYSPTSKTNPLIKFFEFINIADMIIQMVDIFYKQEMIAKNIIKLENSILNPSLQYKKKLEAIVDKFVADGLNIGIEILVNEIEEIYKQYSTPEDYNPARNGGFGCTEAAKKALVILEENIDLLSDSADVSIVEVFQQEIAERFFQIIVKNLKSSTISVSGATNLISDLNAYYEFISSHIKLNKRMIMPLYQSLKNVGSMYLISGDDAKAIGKLVSDLSKFNGIFGQEEIYEFVQRREDWSTIRRHVEKVMYGFGIADCKIM